MPRVRVSAPTPGQAVAHGREFAVLHELQDESGVIDTEALAKFGGKPDALEGKSEVEFDAFAAAAKAPSQSEGVEGTGTTLAWAARDTSGILSPLRIERRAPRPKDVQIQIAYAGMCHSDLHTVRGEWGTPKYPVVPGHEIVGFVTAIGSEVTKFKVGDRAGVGCLVDSCRTCEWCKGNDEQYCSQMVLTYNGTGFDGVVTQGGYSTDIVVDEAFVVKVPDSIPLERAAPLLCAGITTYTPLTYYGLNKPGMKVGVNGLGGLGHMAVKLAKAFGAEVTVLSRGRAKEEAAKKLGADNYLVSGDEEAMKAAAGSLDGIVDTVSADHDVGALLALLRPKGKLCLVGAPPTPTLAVPHFSLLFKQLTFGGSLIGGLKATQEMLDFCAEKGVACDVEVIPMSEVNQAMDRLEKGDVQFRFVIDVTGSLVA